jgi:hypothetical protein
MAYYGFGSNATEVKGLASGINGQGDIVEFGGGKNKYGLLRGFFQGFQQGVESLLGQHVHFVNDINFIPPVGREITDIFPQFPDVIYPPIGGPVNLEDIQVAPLGNLLAGRAAIAGVGGRAFLAVQGLGQDTGHRGLAHSPGPAEQVGMGHPTGFKGILEGPGYVGLADDLFKNLGPEFPG